MLGNYWNNVMISISSLRTDRKSLEVSWSDHAVTRYPWVWLRDHAHDDDTVHPVTQQRQLFTAALPADLVGTAVKIQGDTIDIAWSDNSAHSVVPVPFLARYRTPCKPQLAPHSGITPWNAAFIHAHVPKVGYEAVMNTDDGVREWLTKTAEFGFCLAVGTPPTAHATEALLRRIGYVRETIFGGMWEFTADLARADTAYTNLELRPHTDGTYSNDAPGAQLLHCLQFDGTGGESTMVDAFALARHMATEMPEHFTILATVVVPGQYIGDGSHLMAARPVFRHDHNGQLVQVSFNNYDRAPFLLPENEMIAFYAALRAFDNLANDPAWQWRHVLAPGEALLFDNWRVLHGRFAYTGLRRLCGGYVNREDIESRLRHVG